jgi:hypothetical protein
MKENKLTLAQFYGFTVILIRNITAGPTSTADIIQLEVRLM